MDDEYVPAGWYYMAAPGRTPWHHATARKRFPSGEVVVYFHTAGDRMWRVGLPESTLAQDLAERGAYPSRLAACMAAEVIYG